MSEETVDASWNKDVFVALAAIGWADGTLDPDEARARSVRSSVTGVSFIAVTSRTYLLHEPASFRTAVAKSTLALRVRSAKSSR